MSLKTDTKYVATVKDAYLTESKMKGTAGIFFAFDTDDGPIEHTEWVTHNTVTRLQENLGKCFGITAAQLVDDNFLETLGDFLRGKQAQLTTTDEEHEGKTRVVVQWMNPLGFAPKRITGDGIRRIAGLFSGGPASSPAYTNRGTTTDLDDLPF